MQERTAYRKYRFGHSARCVQWPYPVVSISVASRLWLFWVAMFFRHESVLLFPPGLPPRSCIFCELFRSCRRSGRWCWREYRWHIAWQFVVHILWFGVEWPVRLPLEAGFFFVSSKDRSKLVIIWRSRDTICGIKLWVMHYVYTRMLLHSRKLRMCCISKPFSAFLNIVYINRGEVTFYERGLLRTGFLSHDCCHIKWLLPLLLFGNPCTQNLSGVSIDVKCTSIPSTSSSNVFETNDMLSPVGQCLFTSD